MLPIFLLSLISIFGAPVEGAPFIVGGKDADVGEWPWQLALFSNSAFSCGASIIGPTSAVTAAHCVEGIGRKYSILAGTNNVTHTCKSGECFRRNITKATIHPDYQRNSTAGYPNDIAVITWKDPIKEVSGNVNVKYVKRATNTNQVGKNCYITGWGRLRGFGPLPTWLQEAEIDILKREECVKLWSETLVSDKHVCVMDKKAQGKGACNGDSGGPLVCEETPKKWELVGATSWGSFGCSTTKPSVYTRISSYNSWIDSVINKPIDALLQPAI